MTIYKRLANDIAHQLRVKTNACMFEQRGMSWGDNERERPDKKKLLLTPEEYVKAYGPIDPPVTKARVDTKALSAENRKRSVFSSHDNRAGFTRKQREQQRLSSIPDDVWLDILMTGK